jgi:hypothetical protein
VEIQIDPHTLERAEERGTNEAEIEDVVTTGFPIPGKHGREGRGKVYPFRKLRRGRFYEQKRVEVFYIEEAETVITVTVYVFYGRWEAQHADSL